MLIAFLAIAGFYLLLLTPLVVLVIIFGPRLLGETRSLIVRAGTPKGPAAGPERNETTPILSGAGSCANAWIGATMTAAETAAASFLRLSMKPPMYCMYCIGAADRARDSAKTRCAFFCFLMTLGALLILHHMDCLVKQQPIPCGSKLVLRFLGEV